MGENNRIEYKRELTPELNIENKVAATITPMERVETPLWNKVALREAVINAIVHNDYSFEVPPKFEIFPDRLEITSAGRLPESLSREEFFNGISIPRNKELMRIYRDVELVESLGSGILQMTILDKPNSREQRYFLTQYGLDIIEKKIKGNSYEQDRIEK